MIFRAIQSLFWTFARWLLHLRYRVRVDGLEKLRDLKGPTLVMPNHPGYIDPPLVLSHVRLGGPVRPLVYTGMYRTKGLYPIMRLVHALEVPELSEQSQSAQERTLETIDRIVEAIDNGENIIIYPSGRLQRGDREVIGAARAAQEILTRAPNVNVVLVRTRGVWGSMFSCAQVGGLPDLGKCSRRAIWYGLGSLCFFLPRRDVHMTVEVVDRDKLPCEDREQLNRYLEQWYNVDAPEPPKYVPYHHLIGAREFEYPKRAAGDDIDFDKISDDTRAAVNEMLEEHVGRPLTGDEAHPDRTLDDLGLDSLERMEVALEIEDRFGFRSDRVANTVGQLWALAEGLLRGADEEVVAPKAWDEAQLPDTPCEVYGETVGEAFLKCATANANDVACGDQLSGVLTYRRTLVGATLMAKRFREMPGDAVGVMLPASVASDIVFYALHLAGKLPVILNWTTGPANLGHAIRTMGIKRVVTSRRFIDRLRIELKDGEFAFLEDLGAEIGTAEKVRTLLATYLAPGSFAKWAADQNPDDPAVVLFTSGSENAPKAVPLSHTNLLTNVRAAIEAMELTRRSILLGMLPPFHSFGLMAGVALPFCVGLRVVHYPDPTDAAGIAKVSGAYHPTITATTPTFLGYILATATKEQLASFDIITTGAEKCPEAIFDRAAEMMPDAAVYEGYGITECSPVVSSNRRGKMKHGTVGTPVRDVEILLVHPETGEPIAEGETGMLLVRGPSIFAGYLHYDGASPFVEAEGKTWYKTGDLVRIDDQGFIHFSGRLKRFLKAGGEMISLPALEEPFQRVYPPSEDGPQVAVEGIEKPDGRCIVLFGTMEMTPREANQILADAGMRGVMRIDECRRLPIIPVLGTGKTDYKALRTIVEEMNR